jgi:HAD superfamily hydrolase (TIGR01509 family)
MFNQLMSDLSNHLSCVIFDVDGTLAQTSRLIFASFNHVAGKYLGKSLTNEEIIALFGPPEEGGLSKMLGEQYAASAMDELCDFYLSHHGDMASLHDGMEQVLQFLKKHDVKLAIFTGKCERTTDITLKELGISKYFDLVVTGTDVVNHKPHPEGISKVLQAFSLSPVEALMIGDSMSDVKASRAAGVKMAAAVWDSYDKESMLQSGTEYQFSEVRELFDWFRKHIN